MCQSFSLIMFRICQRASSEQLHLRIHCCNSAESQDFKPKSITIIILAFCTIHNFKQTLTFNAMQNYLYLITCYL